MCVCGVSSNCVREGEVGVKILELVQSRQGKRVLAGPAAVLFLLVAFFPAALLELSEASRGSSGLDRPTVNNNTEVLLLENKGSQKATGRCRVR